MQNELQAFKPEIEASEANEFLFAAAKLLTPKVKDELYECVQDARIEGNWNKVAELTVRFLGEYLKLEQMRGLRGPKVRTVSAEEIAKHPTQSLSARDYFK
jgi:hypothetical protein